MAQLYLPPINRLLRSLLLQCVFLLGIVAVGVAQAPLTYDGPWRTPTSPNVITDKLSADGLELDPGANGGSAQFRTTESFVDIKIQESGSTGQTGYKVSYSLKASTSRLGNYTASMRVSYQVGGVEAKSKTVPVTLDILRDTMYLPSNATNVRFQLADVSNAYLFLDAVTVSQEPEVEGFTPASGVEGTSVIISGRFFNEVTEVYFGNVAATDEVTNPEGTAITATVPAGASTAKIRVVTPYGSAESFDEFIVDAPVFNVGTPFTPAEGGAGQSIILYGQNFVSVDNVQFNGVDAGTFEFTPAATEGGDDQIKVTIPAGASSGPITLVSPAGNAISTNFTVLPPSILTFAPAEGGAVGTPVTITGDYLIAVTKVLFNGAEAAFSLDENNNIVTTVPLGASTGSITLQSSAGNAVSSDIFDVPAPQFIVRVIDGASYEFMPTSAGPGMQVTIYGDNLSSVSSVVFLGGAGSEDDRTATIVTPVTSNTELVVTVPADASSGPIQLIASGDNKTATSTQSFTFVPAPAITSVGTTEGGLTYGIAGEAITIAGSNFETTTQVIFGGVTLTPYNEPDNTDGFVINTDGTAINFNVPANASTGGVAVTTLGGTATWNGPFEVVKAPTYTSMNPTEGPLGQEITIIGTNFKYVSEVIFLGAEADETDNVKVTFAVPNASDTELTVTVPDNALTGALQITNGAGSVTTGVYEVILIPVIQAFDPNLGVAENTVTVTGYNFTGTTAVTFGESASVTAYDVDNNPNGFEVLSDTELTVKVPADATTGVITVTNGEGTGSSSEDFTIIQLPTIAEAGIAPTKGTVGQTVVITGTQFIGDVEDFKVTFLGAAEAGDEVNATTFTVDSPTQITATVPVGAVTGPLTVTNAAGTSEPSADSYTVVTSPEIISFNPTEGKVDDEVIITGWLLDQVTGVQFNGTAADITYNAADKTITTNVPSGATTGPLSLVKDTEVVYTTTAEQIFTVIPAPTIVSFDPAQGVGGTMVTITGTNFEGLSKVTFLGTDEAGDEADADLSALTPAELSTVFTIAVPTNAVTGKIQVTSAGGTVISDDIFTVPVPANITFTPSTSYANQEVVIRGQYFTNASKVSFNGREITNVTVTDEEVGSIDPARFQQITVKAPFDAGTGAVTVTTPAGTGTSIGTYTVTEPIINDISVVEGYAEYTSVTVTGENFTKYFDGTSVVDKEPIVRFGGVLAEVEPGYTNQSLTVKVPVGATSGAISVESGSGIGYSEEFNILLPVITNYSINPAYAGQTVIITGNNFIDVQGLTFKGVEVAIVAKTEAQENGTITFVAPKINDPSRTGTGTLRVITLTGGSSETSNFTVIKPNITSVAPTRIYAGLGKELTITGSDFKKYYNTVSNEVVEATPRVRFNGSSVDADVKSSTNTQIVAVVPGDATSGAITVESGSGIRTQSNITIIGAPTITSLSANGGLVGNTVTITGTNFDEATSVVFEGTAAAGDDVSASYTVKSQTEIEVTVPDGAVAGPIAVTTPFNGGTTVRSSSYRVVYTPSITGFTPTSAQELTEVTINGENLWDVDGALQVYFKGHGGTTIPAATADQVEFAATVTGYDEVGGSWVTVTVPDDAITGTIRLENTAGSATTSEFEVTSPVIIRFERDDNSAITSSNPVRVRETVLIRGYNLTNLGTVKVGSVNANFLEVAGDETTVEMVVPRFATNNTVNITSAEGSEASTEQLYILSPIITITPTSLTFTIEEGQVSEVKTYTVSAQNLAVGENLNVLIERGANDFQISMSNEADAIWGKSVPALVPDELGNVAVETIYVRNQTTAGVGTNQSGRIINSSFGATTEYVDLSSAVVPLPVELMSFNAALQNNNVLLTWATASEENNSHFEVEMSRDAKNGFDKIGRVGSKGSNSSIRLDYEFTHKLGNLIGTIYYRLKQVDLDGTTDYSKVVAVNVKARELVQQLLVAPNPINYNSKLFVTAEVSGEANLVLYNMTGKKVYSKAIELQEGQNEVQLPVYDKLSKGMYVLKVELNGQVSQIKVIKE